jgi:CheY-like chemotaxis protein
MADKQVDKRPSVWLIDDEERNHLALDERHGERFNIRHFYEPAELLAALEEERPDLLLSDVFFLEPGRDEEGAALQAEAAAIRGDLADFAERYRGVYQPAGLELADKLRREYPGLPNVVYSNKAPLLLDEGGFSRITTAAGPVWIFKGHESIEAERLKIDAVLQGAEHRKRYLRLKGLTVIVGLLAAAAGWVLGLVLSGGL